MVWTSSTSTSDPSQLAPGLFAGTDTGEGEQATAPDPLVGQLLDSRYRVIERLAEGGMGTVYRAEHIALHKEVAIKLVQDTGNSDHATRFLREALLTSRIDHPNVVSAIDYGTFEQGAAYLVMGLVEGPTLAHTMRYECPMSWVRAAVIGAQLADAVAAAQAQGIVHRDLKPENVVLQPLADGTEVVKVLDFGIAKYARDSLAPPQVRGAQHVTQVGVVVGTPGYMAPEQAVGMRADHRADLYAIGVMLWECVAGRRLWDCDDVQLLLTAQLSRRPLLLRAETGDPTISEAFEALVAELLATRPENRPQSAIDARDRLRSIVEAEWQQSQSRVELPSIAVQAQMVPPPPPGTDTVFINAAVAGWGANARQTAEPPTTQVGFRAPARLTQGDLPSAQALEPASEPADDRADDPADDIDIALKPRASLRRYIAAPLALAALSVMLWAALPGEPSTARLSASVRPRATPTAERRVASNVDATPAAPAQSRAVSTDAANAPAALPVQSSARPAAHGLGAVARARSDRELADALRAKARAHFRRAEFELAAQAYRLAIKARPGHAGAYAGLGASQLALGDARGAITSYKRAIRRLPGTSGFHAALGRAYVMTSDQANALAEYQKAVALDPSNEVAFKALATLTP